MIKLKHLVSIFLCGILLTTQTYGTPYQSKTHVGILKEDPNVLIVQGNIYPLYSIEDELYIPLSYLEKMGLRRIEEKGIIYIDYGDTVTTHPPASLNLKDQMVSLSNQVVYIGALRTYVIEVGNELLIPLPALKILWQIEVHQGAYVVAHSWLKLNHFIDITEEEIINHSALPITVDLQHIFWNGKQLTSYYEKGCYLEPGQARIKYPVALNQMGTYHTTLILQINGLPTQCEASTLYGQTNDKLFVSYTNECRKQYLTHLFPSFKVMGKMRYKVEGFEEKERVEIWRAEKTYYYVIKDVQGKLHQVPFNSISLEGDPGTLSPKVAAEDIEDFVRLHHITSETPYIIWTDLYRQRTYVLHEEDGSWHLEKSFICSSGRPNNTTPTGIFKIEYSMPYFGLDKNFRCKNAMVFYGNYMYHSILFDKTGAYIKSGQYDLGRRVSHGCIRLSEKDSMWLYQNIPVGTTVWIR